MFPDNYHKILIPKQINVVVKFKTKRNKDITLTSVPIGLFIKH